jgi:AcrR family transcriptional regulator
MPGLTSADDSTRDKVLAAAIELILEQGYYRASSNSIAKRAGVSWGVIQHHFGTRERLLLAMVLNGTSQLVDLLREAEIHGETVEERIDSLADVIWDHYRQPEFRAYVLVLLNLSREPRTSADTVEALADNERLVGELWSQLVARAIPIEDPRLDLSGVIFHLIRGLAIGSSLIQALPYRPNAHVGAEPREVLVHALTLYVADVSSSLTDGRPKA